MPLFDYNQQIKGEVETPPDTHSTSEKNKQYKDTKKAPVETGAG